MPGCHESWGWGEMMLGSRTLTAEQETGGADVARYFGVLRRFFARRAHAADVDDLVQDVALRMETRRVDTPIENVEGYLFQVARSVLNDHARRDGTRCRNRHDSLEEFHHPVEVLSPQRVVEGREEVQRLVAALDTLPQRARQAFVLHRFEDMSYGAIAQHMGITVSAVEKHIARAVRQLTEAAD